MNREERAHQLETIIGEALADLESQLARGKTEAFMQALAWWSNFRTYSFNNAVLIRLQRPDATCVAGFRKWQSLGFNVRKGERGIFIRGSLIRKEIDPKTGEQTERLAGYIPLAVFDITQTREYPTKQPPSPYQPETTADWEHLYECFRRRLATLYDIHTSELDMGALTFGTATSQHIRINSRQPVSIKAMVLIHETCHIAARHTTVEGRKQWSLQQRELQVEASSFVLCQMLGATHPNAANYLLHYKVEPGMLAEHLEMIGRIVRDVRHMLDFDSLGKQEAHVA